MTLSRSELRRKLGDDGDRPCLSSRIPGDGSGWLPISLSDPKRKESARKFRCACFFCFCVFLVVDIIWKCCCCVWFFWFWWWMFGWWENRGNCKKMQFQYLTFFSLVFIFFFSWLIEFESIATHVFCVVDSVCTCLFYEKNRRNENKRILCYQNALSSKKRQIVALGGTDRGFNWLRSNI